MITNIIDKISKQASSKIDEWAISNWVTIENAKKFRMKVTNWVTEYKLDENSMKIKINARYDLYPARWRNAKKLISSITL